MADYTYTPTLGWLFDGEPVTEPEDLATLASILQSGYTSANEGENGIEPAGVSTEAARQQFPVPGSARPSFPSSDGPLGPRPSWWPNGEPWPPMHNVPDEKATRRAQAQDENAPAVYKDEPDYKKVPIVKTAQRELGVDVGDEEKPDSIFRDQAQAQARADEFNATGGTQYAVVPSGTGYALKAQAQEAPSSANYRPERYTDPKTGQGYERLSPEGPWKPLDAPQVPQVPQVIQPDQTSVSWDQMIGQEFMARDYAKGVAIDDYRDMIGVDRMAVANNVISLYLSNATADQIRTMMKAPPPLLAMALDRYRQALLPGGGVDMGKLQVQNQEMAPSLSEGIIAMAKAGMTPRDPYTLKPLLDPNATFPGGPVLDRYAQAAGVSQPPAPGQADYARAGQLAQQKAYGEFQAEDYAQTGGVYQPRPTQPGPSAYGEDTYANAQPAYARTQMPTVDESAMQTPQAPVYFSPDDYIRPADQPVPQAGRDLYGEDTGQPYVTPSEQPAGNAARKEAIARGGNVAYGDQEFWKRTVPYANRNQTLPPEEQMRQGKANFGALYSAGYDTGQASQASGYYGAEWDAMVAEKDRQAALRPKQTATPSVAYSDILGPLADAAQEREDQRRKRSRTPVYVG